MSIDEQATIERWRRAVVHIECAADSTPTFSDIPWDQRKSRDVRWSGTALYLQDPDGSSYLATARHVLHDDEMAALHALPESPSERFQRENGLFGGRLDEFRASYAKSWIAPIIFRVSQYRGAQSAMQRTPQFLTHLNVGNSDSHAYTYSSPEDDLAVISLRKDVLTDRFDEDLFAHEYVPISTTDIANGPAGVGSHLHAVGFPGYSNLGRRGLEGQFEAWESNIISAPVSSWGRVGLDDPELPFFWADMTIYPGNSGGPVIENDKLVGIVSAQAVVENARVPFAKVMKSGKLHELLAAQREKDARWYEKQSPSTRTK